MHSQSVQCAALKAPSIVELPRWFSAIWEEPLFFVSTAGPHLGTGFAELTADGQSMSVVGSKAGLYTVIITGVRAGFPHVAEYRAGEVL